jgi:hypothetical protein
MRSYICSEKFYPAPKKQQSRVERRKMKVLLSMGMLHYCSGLGEGIKGRCNLEWPPRHGIQVRSILLNEVSARQMGDASCGIHSRGPHIIPISAK